jgi:PBSX family phage terminase large subunit
MNTRDTGLWYKRFIEGKWVVAQGAVYDFFDEEIHVIPYARSEATYYIVGVDYGIVNPTCFVLLGYNAGSYPNMWIEKEYCHDSRKTERQKSDYDYTLDLIDFIDGLPVDAIYVDPSASSFKLELRRNGVNNVRDAVNDVVPGIRFVSKLLTNGTLKICSSCTGLIKEFSNYLWDSKATEKGFEKPIKRSDHFLDATRYSVVSHFFERSGHRMTEEDANDLERAYTYR